MPNRKENFTLTNSDSTKKINKKKTYIQKRFTYSPPKDDIGW